MTRQDDSQGVGCFANGPLPVQTAGGTGIMCRKWKLTEAQRMRKCLSQLDPPSVSVRALCELSASLCTLVSPATLLQIVAF